MLFWEGVCQFIHGKKSTSMVFAGGALQFCNGAFRGVEGDIPKEKGGIGHLHYCLLTCMLQVGCGSCSVFHCVRIVMCGCVDCEMSARSR